MEVDQLSVGANVGKRKTLKTFGLVTLSLLFSVAVVIVAVPPEAQDVGELFSRVSPSGSRPPNITLQLPGGSRCSRSGR